jgi:hypothetical protein
MSIPAAITDLAAQVTNVFEAITFVEFIYEESCQMYIMAIYLGIRYKAWNSVLTAYYGLRNYLLPEAEDYTNFWGYWAGYSQGAFKAFWLGVRNSLIIIEEVLRANGITVAPPPGT